jgi:hypothetical protein
VLRVVAVGGMACTDLQQKSPPLPAHSGLALATESIMQYAGLNSASEPLAVSFFEVPFDTSITDFFNSVDLMISCK